MTTYFSQGIVATDLRGGDNFNSNFLHRSHEFNDEKLWKLAHLCRSYSTSKLARNFWHTLYRKACVQEVTAYLSALDWLTRRNWQG